MGDQMCVNVAGSPRRFKMRVQHWSESGKQAFNIRFDKPRTKFDDALVSSSHRCATEARARSQFGLELYESVFYQSGFAGFVVADFSERHAENLVSGRGRLRYGHSRSVAGTRVRWRALVRVGEIGRGNTGAVEIVPKLLDEADSVFEAVGGVMFFERLVGLFYDQVRTDEVLLRTYPEPDNLGPAKQRLTQFLIQYWGGPTTYSDARGHPRLRMRHAPFVIGDAERDHWLAAMNHALDELQPASEVRARFDSYFAMAADAMRNQ